MKTVEDIRFDDLDLESGGELRAEKLLADSWWLSHEERDVGEGRGMTEKGNDATVTEKHAGVMETHVSLI